MVIMTLKLQLAFFPRLRDGANGDIEPFWNFPKPRKSRWIGSAGLGLAGLIALGIPAAAATTTATTSFAVTATVMDTCVVSATPLAFGNYTGVQSDSTATLSITCTNTTPYTVGLNAGLATGATVTTRKMMGPASAVLPYGLFSDAARTVNWGVTVPSDTVGGTGSGTLQTLTVYGRIADGSYVAPGAYADTVTATVTY